MADGRDIGDTRLAVIAGLVMIAIYAAQFVAARFSLREHLTATDMAGLRFAGAGAVFLPIVWRRGLATMKALGWRRGLTLAALAGLPYPLIINWGLTHAPAAHAAALCPASIVFFSFLLSLFRESASRRRIIGVVTIIAGLLLFIAPARTGASDVLFGDLLFIGSGAMFSTYAVLVQRWRVDPVTATASVVLLSCQAATSLCLCAKRPPCRRRRRNRQPDRHSRSSRGRCRNVPLHLHCRPIGLTSRIAIPPRCAGGHRDGRHGRAWRDPAGYPMRSHRHHGRRDGLFGDGSTPGKSGCLDISWIVNGFWGMAGCRRTGPASDRACSSRCGGEQRRQLLRPALQNVQIDVPLDAVHAPPVVVLPVDPVTAVRFHEQ